MGRSGLDEQFKVFLGLTVGYHLDGNKTYRLPVLKTLAHNRKLRSDILASMRRVVINDPSIHASQAAMAIPLNHTAHDTVVEKIVRGLYFHHTGAILGDKYSATVQWHMVLDDELFNATKDLPTGTIGDPALIYKYGICADDPAASIWVLQFFHRTWSSVVFGLEEVDFG